MKNIHVLHTDKSSRLSDCHDNKLYLDDVRYLRSYQNIYITSNEKFVRDEYITDGIEVIKAFPKLVDAQGLVNRRNWRKIILTTDQDLIKDGVQAIDDEFLEWFVKNPSCERVEVKSKVTKDGVWTDLKGYVELSTTHSIIHKIIIPKEEPKQETLEEVAFNAGEKEFKEFRKGILEASRFDFVCGFTAGAKWQQEQDNKLYSDKEVKHLMTLAFEQGFKKADVVEAGLEAKETDTEVNWIFLKHKK